MDDFDIIDINNEIMEWLMSHYLVDTQIVDTTYTHWILIELASNDNIPDDLPEWW